MADTAAPTHSAPRPIQHQQSQTSSTGHSLPQSSASRVRDMHLALDTLSPVNQRGHFEFDRVIKSGPILKRTRKTKSWRSVHIVLRPNLLSIYRNPDETKLRHKIILSDLTAVARQKDPKGRAKHVFGLFTPSRNYHLAARDDKQAQEWVELIRQEARIDEEEEDMNLVSPGGRQGSVYTGFGRPGITPRTPEGLAFSSSDAEPLPEMSPTRPTASNAAHSRPRRPSTTMEYSGPENASYSDFSDTVGPAARLSALSLSRPTPARGLEEGVLEETPSAVEAEDFANRQPEPAQEDSSRFEDEQARKSVAAMQEAARIVCQGWVLLLKSRSGVKQWKKTWAVLRTRSLTMYKNEKEYTAVKILPLESIVDAVEIDPISSSKRFCMQIITEEKGYRFCTPDEDSLTRWLGSLKSLFVKRRELQAS